jgi:hypothetical protein
LILVATDLKRNGFVIRVALWPHAPVFFESGQFDASLGKIMKSVFAYGVGGVSALTSGVAWAQGANMMNGAGWGGGWMGGYGGIWGPILLVVLVAGLVAWVVKRGGK